MPLTIVGSGTLVPSPLRASPSHLVESGKAIVLLDIGPGSVHGMARLDRPWWSLTHIVLSHFHTDHIGDLPHLLFALQWAAPTPRSLPLRILGPPGLQRRVDGLMQAHGSFIREQRFPIEYVELTRHGAWRDGSGLEVGFAPARHTEDSVCVRLSVSGGTVGYSGDTGPDPDLGSFLAGTDLLICECAFDDPPPGDNHLSPTSVARLARAAAPGLLVLSHVYPPLQPESLPERVRQAGFAGTVVAAEDGARFRLPGDPEEGVDEGPI